MSTPNPLVEMIEKAQQITLTIMDLISSLSTQMLKIVKQLQGVEARVTELERQERDRQQWGDS